MPVRLERQFAIWREFMVSGETISDLWRQIRHISPEEIKALDALALVLASEMMDDPAISLLDRRRALLIAQLATHRVVFDLMGLMPTPHAELSSEVCRLFFT